jgi:uncharacterized protein involved in copper resistance
VRNQVAIRWARKPWLAALLLLALGSRLLIPAGFMPGPGGLVLCAGHGPMLMSMPSDMAGMDMSAMDMSGMDMSGMDMSGMDMSQHAGTPGQGGRAPDHESSGVCPFAAAATTMAALNVSSLSVHSPFFSTAIALPPQRFIPRGTIVPTQLPRGPPVFA